MLEQARQESFSTAHIGNFIFKNSWCRSDFTMFTNNLKCFIFHPFICIARQLLDFALTIMERYYRCAAKFQVERAGIQKVLPSEVAYQCMLVQLSFKFSSFHLKIHSPHTCKLLEIEIYRTETNYREEYKRIHKDNQDLNVSKQEAFS